ncbi:MAG TPA: 2,3,4,5-tetrahydropyridine-2,6-dicarboxylate N-succinyltransferase [Gammaproteobacteria bacterium]|nr:2,3,4,5-tetrahydropyridine-2,6-dicarboxylate N-succinyltransferase [Gammaproteobacteria bacterium]
MSELEKIIDESFERRNEITPSSVGPEVRRAIEQALARLESGEARVAEKRDGRWRVNEWLKKAVLLSFRIEENRVVEGGFTRFFDKVPTRYQGFAQADFERQGARVVPPATVRRGSHIASNVVLMPCYVNIGAFIDSGSMIDTWATVGSCAQIGRNVHISGGAGIGGVLEPLQASPCIVEDNCFIGARSEIVEGVVVGEGSVISMGVFIGQSTPIYHRETGEILRSHVPAGSVVVPGSLPAKDGSHSLYCAVIVKQVDAGTRGKVSINELLRNVQ